MRARSARRRPSCHNRSAAERVRFSSIISASRAEITTRTRFARRRTGCHNRSAAERVRFSSIISASRAEVTTRTRFARRRRMEVSFFEF